MRIYFSTIACDCTVGICPISLHLELCVRHVGTVEVFLIEIRKLLITLWKAQVEVYLECQYSRELTEAVTSDRKGL